jgi:hypothetical protein
MLESIARKGQYNHYSQRSFQNSDSRHLDVRSAFIFYVAVFLLIASSVHSNAEDAQKTSAELGKSGQSETDGQNQTMRKKAAKPKTKCMPKQPCPDTQNPQ